MSALTTLDEEKHQTNINPKKTYYISSQSFLRDKKSQLHSCSQNPRFGESQFSSNLEFTGRLQGSTFPKSIIYVRPDINNITPNKINLESRQDFRQKPPKPVNKTEKSFNSEESSDDGFLKKISEQVSKVEDSISLYKIWPGNNKFSLKGRIMRGPKSGRQSNLIAWIFLIVISLVFFGLIFHFLTKEITVIMPALSIYLFVSTVLFFLLTSFTNPGIIPRKCFWELHGELPDPLNANTRRDLLTTTLNSLPTNPHTTIEMNKSKFSIKEKPIKFCTTCEVNQPAKVVHCKECGNCVEMWMRHSYFINNCIGKGNYRFFISFLVSFILLCVCELFGFLMVMVLTIGSNPDEPNTVFESKTITVLISLILGAPSVLLFSAQLFMLFSYILFKITNLSNETKNKYIRTHFKSTQSSFEWIYPSPSFVEFRDTLTKDQVLKIQKSLLEKTLTLSQEKNITNN